jgi:hypothetical protein
LMRDVEDSRQLLFDAEKAASQGRYDVAESLLKRARQAGPFGYDPWFDGTVLLTELAWAARRKTVDERSLVWAGARLKPWYHRRALSNLKFDFYLERQEYRAALAAAEDVEELEREAGLASIPARSALARARLGEKTEAVSLAEMAMSQLASRREEARLPYLPLAKALYLLDKEQDVGNIARSAYEEAWGSGPPYSDSGRLAEAAELLKLLNRPIPDLRTYSVEDVQVPAESDVQELIESLVS